MAEDRIEELERQDTKTRLPLGWLLLAVGLLVWGMYYSISYIPAISGWTQEHAYHESVKK